MLQHRTVTLSTAESTAPFMEVDLPPPRDMLREGTGSNGRGGDAHS